MLINSWLQKFRLRLANADSLLHYAVLGVVSGFFCSLVMLAFRFVIERPSSYWLPDHHSGDFEALPSWLHFALPVIGAIILGLILRRMATSDTRTGIAHVIARLHAHHGHMPLKNALVQFFGGAIALATGQSGGREGPAIHLGAAVNSLLGQYLLLPNNSIRVLVGCGTAAAIASSFNTPIAGVIFAMEVVMMEYTIAGFTPVILATITATAVTQAVHGNNALFQIPTIEMASLWELPFIAFLGLIIGACASLFITILKIGVHYSDRPVVARMLTAGLVTGCCALLVPEIMGIGYDSINQALSGELTLTLLIAIIAAKILATAISCGLGMPIGLIGPNLLIGACIGCAFGMIGTAVFPGYSSSSSFYVMLGMGAMMGAVLNAPLAALMALLELTQNPNIIFPGMLAIIVASLTNSEIFKQQSAHQTVLTHLRELLRTDPVSLALQRISVASIMKRDFSITPQHLSAEEARLLLDVNQPWFLIDGESWYLVDQQDLFQSIEAALIDCGQTPIDLVNICHNPKPVAEWHLQATLREALDIMDQSDTDALFINGYISGHFPDSGLLMRSDIESHYLSPQK